MSQLLHKENKMKKIAPYQLFFPLGLLNALLAVGVWFVQDLNWFQSPALFIHSRLVIGGFLWSFIVGFLMTAVPRMTGTESANKIEYTLAILLMLGQSLFAWPLDGKFFYINHVLLVLFLIIYGLRRVFKRTKPLPVFFSHIGVAMILAACGSYYHAVGNSYMGIHLYHVGAVLLLVLGIGARFFSFLSGLPSVFENSTALWPRRLFHGFAFLVGILLYLSGLGISFAYLGLTLISLIYLFGIWKVQRTSNRPSFLKWGVRIVAAMIPLSFFLTWLQPTMYITWFHLLFIGCFSLITLSVATRVTLAHGAYPIDLEMKSPALFWLVFFIVLGIIFRVLYGFDEGSLRSIYLQIAVTFWICAIGSWCWSFLPRIFKVGPQVKASC